MVYRDDFCVGSLRKESYLLLPYVHIILPSYTVMAFIGAFSILLFLFFRFEKFGLTFNQFTKVFVISAFACVLGSKLLYFIVSLLGSERVFSLSEIILLFLGSGYVFYGGLFGVLIGIWIFAKRVKSIRPYSLYQMTAPALPLFHGFGRIGCLLAACCYGVTLDEPLVILNVIEINAFPTQFIESMYEFSLFFVLCLIEKLYKDANLLKIYLIGYAVFRFFIEFYRADTDRGMWLWFSTAQWISILIILYFATNWFRTCLIKHSQASGTIQT